MDIIKRILFASVYIAIVYSNIAWAVISKEPSNGVSYLFITVSALGGIIAFLGIILAFRGVVSPAEVSIKIPIFGEFKSNKVGQGVMITIIGAIIMVSALYLFPQTTTTTTTKTITTESEDGTHTSYSETMAR